VRRYFLLKKPPDLKFLADEGFSFEITSLLREMGCDVKWIGDSTPGISDRDVYKIAQEDNRVILTDDKDFGELAVRFNLKTIGVVLLRINPKEKELRNKRVFELLERFSEKLKMHLVVIDSEKFRFRKL
jgi:predicted nuclease of predicted toxin-antitoxin system